MTSSDLKSVRNYWKAKEARELIKFYKATKRDA
jgi:hypothetical protein